MRKTIAALLLTGFAAGTASSQEDPRYDVSTAASMVTTLPFLVRFDHPLAMLVTTAGFGTSVGTSLGLQASGLLEIGGGSYFFQTGLMYLRESTQSSTGIPLLAKINFDQRYQRYTLKAGVVPAWADQMNLHGLVAAGVELPMRGGNDLRFEIAYVADPKKTEARTLLASVGYGLGLF